MHLVNMMGAQHGIIATHLTLSEWRTAGYVGRWWLDWELSGRPFYICILGLEVSVW